MDSKPDKTITNINNESLDTSSKVNTSHSVDRSIEEKVEETFEESPQSIHEQPQVRYSEKDFPSDSRIFVPEFQDKSKLELFEIIIDIVHSSPTYSRNKNLIAKYLQDHNQEIDIDYLTEQLDLSYNEIFVLLSEIKQDFK